MSRLVYGLVLGLIARTATAQVDYSKYVNPLIGAEGPFAGQAFGGGDIFVGGAVPFGVAKVGLDTAEANLSRATLNGGYTPKGKVTAISMMHESGTGGAPKYGIIAQMPLTTVSSPVNLLDNRTYWQERIGDDTAAVGYFKTQFENGITVELSGSRHAGIMQYTYPSNSTAQHVLVDVSHVDLPKWTVAVEFLLMHSSIYRQERAVIQNSTISKARSNLRRTVTRVTGRILAAGMKVCLTIYPPHLLRLRISRRTVHCVLLWRV